MFEVLFIFALVFAAGVAVGYGVRSQISLAQRARARRKF